MRPPVELDFLPDDFSECNDLAASEREKLAHLQDLWWSELEHHGGLPYDTRTMQLFNTPRQQHTPHQSRRYHYVPPVSHIPGWCVTGHRRPVVDDDRNRHHSNG